MHQTMNRRIFELFPLLLVLLSGALSAQSMDQQEFREILDPYLGIWSGEYRIFSQQDELLNSFKVERKYWWKQTIMMEQVTYDFGDMQQTYFNRIVLSDGMPFSFVTDSPESEKIRSALRGSSLKGTMIWTRVLPKGSLPVRISERIVKKGEERFIDFWGDQEAINNKGESMFVRIEGYLVFKTGSRDYRPSAPEPEIPESVIVPDEPLEPIVTSVEPAEEQSVEYIEQQEEVSIEEPEPHEVQTESTDELQIEDEEPIPEEEPVKEIEPEIPEVQPKTLEEEPAPEPVIQEPEENPEPVIQPEEPKLPEPEEASEPEPVIEAEEQEIPESEVEALEPVVQEELPPPLPPMPNPTIRSALESMNVVGIRDKKGDECIVVDYMLLYRPGDQLDMETICYFTGIDETSLHFKDENGFEYQIPRKDKKS